MFVDVEWLGRNMIEHEVVVRVWVCHVMVLQIRTGSISDVLHDQCDEYQYVRSSINVFWTRRNAMQHGDKSVRRKHNRSLDTLGY